MRSLLATLLLLPLAPLAAASSGLKIDKTLTHACSRRSKNGDSLTMHYRGTLQLDGSQFDASYDRDQPFTFKIGAGMVIKGWEKGLLGMCPGDKRTLTVPPEMGYGDAGIGPIPGGATLIFETELLSIGGVEPEVKEVVNEDEIKEEL